MCGMDTRKENNNREFLRMSKTVWTVTYQDNQVEALNAEQVKVFEDREAARFYALELSKKYDYINTVSYTHLTLPTNREV